MNFQRLPNFVVVGAQKSASTFIQDALCRHPDIYMPKGETRFFEDPEYGSGDVTELAGLFRGRKEKALGIKRPDYLGRTEVPPRIRLKLPEAKIIIVLRNPVDRFVSAYYHYIKMGFLPAIDINAAVPRLLSNQQLPNNEAAGLLSYGRYATHLRLYRRIFPDSQIRVAFHEDIHTDPEGELAKLCAFLGVDSNGIRSLPKAANTGVYSLSRLRLLTRRNRYLYDYDSIPGKLLPRRMTIGRLIPAAAITLADRWFLSHVVGNPRPVLRDDLRLQLAEYYHDEIEGTAELTGRNLDAWR